MNPSYNAGGINGAGGTAGVPGAKPGVIASGADAPEISAPAPSAPMSLNNSGRSGGSAKKWILIVAGIVIVALIVVLIVFAVRPRNGGGSVNSTTLGQLSNYVETGAGFEAELSEKPDDKYIFAIAIGDTGDQTVVANYYAGLKERMSNFENNSSLAQYMMALKIMTNAVNFTEVGDNLLKTYDESGNEAAQQYINDNITCEIGNLDLNSICGLEEAYYKRILSEHSIYKVAGCMTDGLYDTECAIKYYGEENFIKDSNYSGVSQGILYDLRLATTKEMLNAGILETIQSVNNGGGA